MNNYYKYKKFINSCEKELSNEFSRLDELRELSQLKVISAMQKVRLSQSDFHWNTGYGYDDVGREKVESVFADIFKAEDALVRPSIASGTHALSIALQASLLPGDEMLSISGRPYDTLQKVIGIAGKEKGSLKEYGITYNELKLVQNQIDYENIINYITDKTKLVTIQRSIGYAERRAITIDEIEKAIKIVKDINPKINIMVDNCYGEFTSDKEPSEVGADLTVGSLIKNLGGGIALSGGYIVGRSDLIERCSNRLTAPGIGKDCGLTFGTTRLTLQGLFFSPMIVNNALKASLLLGKVFSKLGYDIFPSDFNNRSDIVQAIKFGSKEPVIAFCQALQASSVINSHVVPYPWDMPGYEDQVIMATGGFVDGSSIELSADGPLREPYIVFYQGGTSYDQVKFAIANIIERFINDNLLNKNKIMDM